MCEKLYGIWWRNKGYVGGKYEEIGEKKEMRMLRLMFAVRVQDRLAEQIWHWVYWRCCEE